MESIIERVSKLEAGYTLTEEDVKSIKKVIDEIESVEDNYVDIWKELSDANQELDYIKQREQELLIREMDEEDRARDKRDSEEWEQMVKMDRSWGEV